MADEHGDQADALREEVARLSAENDELRGLFRIEPNAVDEGRRSRAVRVLLLPDPLATDPTGTGPEAVAKLARMAVSTLTDRQPGRSRPSSALGMPRGTSRCTRSRSHSGRDLAG